MFLQQFLLSCDIALKRRCVPIVACLFLVSGIGCATVDPSGDYGRVKDHVRSATGQEQVYSPEDEALVATRVEELLKDGITADEAVQICLLHNPSVQAAFFDVGMARADVVQSGLLSNPTLGLSLRLPSGGGLANFEATLAQNIADLWQIPVRKRVAERALDAAILNLARQVGMAAMDAKAAYFAAFGADRQRTIASKNVDLSKQLLDLTVTRRQAGAGNDIEVNLSRAELLEAELAARRAERQANQARRDLTVLLGLSLPLSELTLNEPTPVPADIALQEDRVVSLAAGSRPDVAAASWLIESAAEAHERELLRVFPTLRLGVGLERMERGRSKGRDRLSEAIRNTAQAGTLSGPDVRFDENNHTDLVTGPTLSMQLPIFDQNQAQIAKAAYAHNQAVKRYEAMMRRVTQDARLATQNARISLDMARFFHADLLPLRRRNLELTREAFRAGRVPLVIVLDAQRALTAARGRFIAQSQEASLALVELERVTALPLDKIIELHRVAARDPEPDVMTGTQP